MKTQLEKCHAFRALHQRAGTFVIPNPWDRGSASLLAALGFEALATTSAGYAFSRAKRDRGIPREEMLAHAADLAAATDLPLSADLENGYSDSPDQVAETVRLAAAAGLAGCSIEDATGRPDQPLYPIEVAVERIRAASVAARSLPVPFTLTARAENFLVAAPDLAQTIARLQAYQEAGADVLYAPGLTSKDHIATLVSSVDRPVNVLLALAGVKLTVADMATIGVKRISVGSAFSRAAYGAFLRAAREVMSQGTFDFAEEAVSYRDLSAMFDA